MNSLSSSFKCSMLKKTILCALLTITLTPAALQAQDLKVLTIGNSFADSVFRYLPSIVKSVPDCGIQMDRANIGGCSLDRHWNEVLKSQKDPNYKPYRKKHTLKELLEKEKWDVVTMQQVSSKSFKLETYEPYFKNLYDYVRKYAPQAKIMIQMTWSYRPDHGAFGRWGVDDPTDMFQKLFKNYTFMGKKYDCPIIPSGLAIHLAREEQPVKFKMPETKPLTDYVRPDKPQEPKGSFILGYSWRKDKNGKWSIGKDLIHLNARGQYLQACVWFAKLFNRPTSEITFTPKEIDPTEASFLRSVAQQAVDQSNQDFPIRYETQKKK